MRGKVGMLHVVFGLSGEKKVVRLKWNVVPARGSL
jgi:hypothetical protein